MRAAGRSSSKALSLMIWKKQVVNRIYDKANDTLVYLAFPAGAGRLDRNLAISTVPLYGQNTSSGRTASRNSMIPKSCRLFGQNTVGKEHDPEKLQIFRTWSCSQEGGRCRDRTACRSSRHERTA